MQLHLLLADIDPAQYIGPGAFLVTAVGLFIRQQVGIERLIDRERQRGDGLSEEVDRLGKMLAAERKRCDKLESTVGELRRRIEQMEGPSRW